MNIGSRAPLLHTARGRRGKSVAIQLVESPCDGPPEVIVGVGMESRKTGAPGLDHSRDGRHGRAQAQQVLGDPFVGNAPIRLRESLRDAQPQQPVLIDFPSHRRGAGCGHRHGGQRSVQRWEGRDGSAAGCLQQRRAVRGQASSGMQYANPGGVAVALSALGFSGW